MSTSAKGHIRQLEHRLAYLEDRIARAAPGENVSEQALAYFRAEYHALIWALPILCEQAEVRRVVYPIQYDRSQPPTGGTEREKEAAQ